MARWKTFWLKPHYLLTVMLLWLAWLPSVYLAAVPDTDLRETIFTNTERILELQRNVHDIHDWIMAHDRQMVISVETQTSQLQELKTTVAAHERILWILITAMIGLIVKNIADVVAQRKNGNNQIHYDEGRHTHEHTHEHEDES